MASHEACSHPRTKAARAACRRGRPQPKLKRQPEARSDAKVYQVIDHNGHDAALEGAQAILANPESHSMDEIIKARQYVYGS